MNLQVFLEWFHRLDAALIGISAISLVGLSWWYRSHLPRWMLAASIFALFCIVFQGILGALTVTQLLRFDIVTAHLGTALFFFSTLIAIATCLTPVGKKLAIPKIWWLALTAAILVYLQCLLGGLVASRWALHQCFGASQLCGVMNGHILGVVPPTLAIFVLAWFAWQTRKIAAIFWKLSFLAIGLVGVQTCLGIATFKLHLQVEPLTVAHETVGASLLGLLVAFSVVSIRDRFSTPTN
jgi:cytochrome c oxidase assembly protein subunit 15